MDRQWCYVSSSLKVDALDMVIQITQQYCPLSNIPFCRLLEKCCVNVSSSSSSS